MNYNDYKEMCSLIESYQQLIDTCETDINGEHIKGIAYDEYETIGYDGNITLKKDKAIRIDTLNQFIYFISYHLYDDYENKRIEEKNKNKRNK